MAFLQLKDIGKIYVSDNVVTVGIRNVNLSFERGEFVAITGASGSGKSTLLNVISGMDSYEEGELYIEGNPTSHFIQSDWEEYREKYISFIFQDYNILESFTVLQNVELALMNIINPRERRQRAIELLERVGLGGHLKQKGSQLSGGQKQRCVIARALAKDSPIILADEPTGNLDAQSSKEIIELLREVSKDKLLFVVTHNFDEVENCATRHVRVFDGAIESDHVLIPDSEVKALPPVADTNTDTLSNNVSLGFELGRATFHAQPKLTTLMCFFLLIGTIGVTLISGLLADSFQLFDKYYMFHPTDGRLVISKSQPAEFTEEELQTLKDKYGAEYYYMYDAIFDVNTIYENDIDFKVHRFGRVSYVHETVYFGVSKDNYGKPSVGRYPEDDEEILLYVPLAYKNYYGYDDFSLKEKEFRIGGRVYKVVGIKYYIDNTKQPRIVVNADAYARLSASISRNWKSYKNLGDNGFFSGWTNLFDMLEQDDGIYNQASLFFKNNRAAKKAVAGINKDGYIACPSDSTYSPDILTVIERILNCGGSLVLWFLIVMFLAFFVNLCTHNSLAKVKTDLVILRSMGIPVRVIKVSLYIRMYMSLIPGIILTAIGATLIYLSKDYNGMFSFLHWYQYLMILLGMLLVTTNVTNKQIKSLFSESVKKSLKGGEEA